jgi:hypothetical protein
MAATRRLRDDHMVTTWRHMVTTWRPRRCHLTSTGQRCGSYAGFMDQSRGNRGTAKDSQGHPRGSHRTHARQPSRHAHVQSCPIHARGAFRPSGTGEWRALMRGVSREVVRSDAGSGMHAFRAGKKSAASPWVIGAPRFCLSWKEGEGARGRWMRSSSSWVYARSIWLCNGSVIKGDRSSRARETGFRLARGIPRLHYL